MLFSQFRVQCHQYHAFFEAHENKSDDLPVMHYQTRRINSKVIYLTMCFKFRANHFRNIELIINHLFLNGWINTTFNCLWWIIPDLRLFPPRCDSGVWEIAFCSIGITVTHMCVITSQSPVPWLFVQNHGMEASKLSRLRFGHFDKLFLILWQYPYQIVSMPLATRNHVSQHYHCSKITLALYSRDVII